MFPSFTAFMFEMKIFICLPEDVLLTIKSKSPDNVDRSVSALALR